MNRMSSGSVVVLRSGCHIRPAWCLPGVHTASTSPADTRIVVVDACDHETAVQLRWLRGHMKVTDNLHGERFFVMQDGVRYATPLLMALGKAMLMP